MRLKEYSKKFSGAIDECLQEFVDEYRQLIKEYDLSPTQRLQFLHNLLRGDAKRFYLDVVGNYATAFQQLQLKL